MDTARGCEHGCDPRLGDPGEQGWRGLDRPQFDGERDGAVDGGAEVMGCRACLGSSGLPLAPD